MTVLVDRVPHAWTSVRRSIGTKPVCLDVRIAVRHLASTWPLAVSLAARSWLSNAVGLYLVLGLNRLVCHVFAPPLSSATCATF